MTRSEAALSLVKLSLASIGAGAGLPPVYQLFSHYIALPVWGVPVTVIMAALAGAGLSLFFGDPIESRRSLVGQVLAAMMFGSAVAVMAADGMDWDWATKNISMFAMMSAAILRWFLQPAIDRGKLFIRDFKFSFTRKGEDK